MCGIAGFVDSKRRSGADELGMMAARMARVMDRWTKLAEPYRAGARDAINRVAARPDLSSDVREIVTRALLCC